MKKLTIIHNKNSDGFTKTQGDDEFINWFIINKINNGDFGNVGEYSYNIEDIIPSYIELRLPEYRKQIDPYLNEAIIENAMGRPDKLNELVAKSEDIRLRYPKP